MRISARFFFTKEDISSLPVPVTKFEGDQSDHLGQLFVTPEKIATLIKKMKDNKSPGVDGIPPTLFKEIVEQISMPLAKTCKLLETLITDHMVEILVKHELINTYQHGFLKARSCLTNLFCFLEEITKWVDDGSPVDVVCLDFQKAFDKMSHQILLL